MRKNRENAQPFRMLEERGISAESVVAAIGDALSIQDTTYMVLYQNQAHIDMIGYHVGEYCYSAYQRREAVCDGCPVALTFKDGRVHRSERKGSTDKKTIYVEVTSSAVFDPGGKIVASIEVARDITGRRLMEEKLRVLAVTDELTGLHNRRGFFTLAHQQLKLANRERRGFILLSVDVDSLKHINDVFGHQEGDLVLVETAGVLKESFRESDIIARIGGDEFVILQGDKTDADPGVLIQRLRDNLDVHNKRKNRQYELGLSIGIASYSPEAPLSIDELLVLADRRMYEHKKNKKT